MTENKPIIIDGVDVSKCENFKSNHDCIDSAYLLFDMTTRYVKCEKCKDCCFKQLAHKTQECEELKEYHNKCCQEFEKEKQDLINKYNQLSRDFYNGKYCNVDKCKQLDQLKSENEELTTINARLLGRLEVDETDTSIVFSLDKELRQKEKEFYTSTQKVVKLKAEKEQAEQKLEQIRNIASNYKNCNNLGFYLQNSEARYALWKVAQAMCNILQLIDEEEQ